MRRCFDPCLSPSCLYIVSIWTMTDKRCGITATRVNKQTEVYPIGNRNKPALFFFAVLDSFLSNRLPLHRVLLHKLSLSATPSPLNKDLRPCCNSNYRIRTTVSTLIPFTSLPFTQCNAAAKTSNMTNTRGLRREN